MSEHGEHKCHVCNKHSPILKRCTRCQSIFYCSTDCQIKDWSVHKLSCVKTSPTDAVHSLHVPTTSGARLVVPGAVQSSKDPGTTGTTRLVDMDVYKPPTASSVHEDHSKDIFGSECMHTGDQVETNTETDQNIKTSIFNMDFDSAIERLASGATGPSKCVCPPCSHSAKPTYLSHNKVHDDVPLVDPDQGMVSIIIKANKVKTPVSVQDHWSGPDILKTICHTVSVPLDKLKLIHKGKMLSAETIKDHIKDKAVFQVIGEPAEDEGGLVTSDIDIIMKQVSVGRNEAIRALKEKGDVLDAILYLANK